MKEILNWKEGREEYRDGECSTYEELPNEVPLGSFWHVIEGDRLFVRWDGLRAVNGWLEVTGVYSLYISGRGEMINREKEEMKYNRDFAKLDGKFPTFAPNPLNYNGNWIGNPSAEMYAAAGYKPVVVEPYPTNTHDGYHCEERWSQTEEAVVQSWELVQDPVPSDDDEIDLIEAANIILGGGML